MKRIQIYRMCLIVSIVVGSIVIVFSSKKFIEENIPEDLYVKANKDISASELKDIKVYPCGKPVGLYLHTNGVLVIGEAGVKDENGKTVFPAKNAVLKGDYIVEVNGEKIHNKAQLINIIALNKDKLVRIKLNRNGKEVSISINPVKDENGVYKLGIWVRDDTQGLGTITYVTSDGEFGALGHGISDLDTGDMIDSYEGDLYNADIWGIKKGEKGEPGGFCGTIEYNDKNKIGSIYCNTSKGIFGKLNLEQIEISSLKEMSVASSKEIKEGHATIMLYFEGKYDEYDVEITKIKYKSESNKNLVITITDKRLLEKTNGIIQGMFTSYNGSNNRKASKIKGFLMF